MQNNKRIKGNKKDEMHLSSRELTHILKVLNVNPGYNSCKYSYDKQSKFSTTFKFLM